ncbi:MAG: (deoxy)nucleoside triphosphate pyrophosphohydrolase [Succinatimonas hippei]|nr:(deoxy)nucleoside triphosphate pyrophosphohydrolase [Succinatimonas hippei]
MSELNDKSVLKTVRVAAAAIVSGGRFLAARRPEGKRFAYMWEFPGGKLEDGESFEQACVREIKEELDCEIENLREIESVEHDYDNFHLSMRLFMCELKEGSVPSLIKKEHSGLIWADESDAMALDWVPADRSHIEAVLRELGIA